MPLDQNCPLSSIYDVAITGIDIRETLSILEIWSVCHVETVANILAHDISAYASSCCFVGVIPITEIPTSLFSDQANGEGFSLFSSFKNIYIYIYIGWKSDEMLWPFLSFLMENTLHWINWVENLF
jgi:hypothetical protein